MLRMFRNNNRTRQRQLAATKSSGFTLIEVMIIAPIVILAISGIVALMITMVGDAIATREENQLVFETQDALNRIEEDTRLTSQFLSTSLDLPSPQGSNNDFTGTAPFTSEESLVMGGLTTDRNPANPDRKLVFYAGQPNACNSDLLNYNRIFQQKIMYYLRDNTLWRRAVVPNHNTNSSIDDSTVCSDPWQRNTCRPGTVATRCETNDSEVMHDVETFDVDYLQTPESTSDIGAENADTATAIRVTLTGKKVVKGREVVSTGSIVGSRVNNVNVDPPAPSIPVISSESQSNNVVFTWEPVPNATSYVVEYRVNGGTVTTRTIQGNNKDDLRQGINGIQRKDTASIKVKARNSTDESIWGTASYTIPDFYPCQLVNGWTNYGDVFAPAGFTKTSAGLVKMKGLIRSGNTAAGTTVCTLPPGFRPADTLVFSVSNANEQSRVDVYPDGRVVVLTNHTSAAWLSLDEIQFIASGSGYSWTNVSFQSGWYNYGGIYAPVQRTTDSAGRTQLQGLARPGSFNNCNTPLASNVPSQSSWAIWAAYAANSELQINGSFNNLYTNTSNQVLSSCNNPSNWQSFQASYYAGSSSGDGWKTFSLQGGWSRYSTSYVDAQYTRGNDDLVTVRGMIRNGCTSGNNCVIATLPEGYRPKDTLIFTGVSNGAYGRVDVQPNGNIVPVGIPSNAWLSLDGISFMAESRDAERDVTDGMVGFYRLNGNAQDSSGYGYNGSIVGTNTPTAGHGGQSSSAISFNGSTYINLGNPSAWPAGTSPKTVCVWARTVNSAGYRWAFSYGNPSANNAFFIGQNGTTMQTGGGFASGDVTYTGGWIPNTWAHVCNVYNGSTAYMYVNKFMTSSRAISWSLIKNRAYIGRQVNDAENWGGIIDEVRVYNRALTQQEVTNLYLYGSD